MHKISMPNFDECCICLDVNEPSCIKLKCCNGTIHNYCLSLLFVNDIKTCPLCRSTLNFLSYFTSIICINNLNNITYQHKLLLKTIYYQELFNKLKYIITCFIIFILCIISLFIIKYTRDINYNKMNSIDNLIDYY
jgi:hypothetical protein